MQCQKPGPDPEYAGKKDYGYCHKQDLCGYRLGTLEEATKLELVQQKPPSDAPRATVSPALGKQMIGVIADAKIRDDKSELERQFRLRDKERLEREVRELKQQQEEDRVEREAEKI